MLQWATLNGAQALGFDDALGSITQGKKPGLNLLDFNPQHERLHAGVAARKIL
jgi:cytosine/adenosine deaminase-related metal-dependent hydrolase